MKLIEYDEQISELNMKKKEILAKEEQCTKYVKDNGNQINKLLTMDNIDNIMQKNKKEQLKHSRSGSKSLRQTNISVLKK